ncbi:MAG: heavy-metal-associated domain-containing protein [Acholeplasmatales bacterium]|nr:heavy-metal-associated domain-containing protein [Acholeplasmatales bacterium]
MIKIFLDVDGMMCGMCEAHINDIVRKTTKIKKIKSNHKKKETIIVLENDNDLNKIIEAIKSLGYNCSLNRIENLDK